MSEKNKKSRALRYGLVGTALVLAAGIAGFSAYTFSLKKEVSKWDNKIYPGVRVNGLDLSGKTASEAIKLLNSKFSDSINNKKLSVKALDQIFELSYSKLQPEFNVEETVNNALHEGKNLSVFGKSDAIKNGINKDLPLSFKYDESKVQSFIKDIESKINKDAKDATIKISNGTINITNDSIGYRVNSKELDKLIKDSINGNVSEDKQIDAPIEKIEPKVSKAALSKIDGRISTFSTNFSTSTPERATNVTLATNFINGKLLMPGDLFSYNGAVGERSIARGFKDAAIFVGDKVEQGVGGGICQVSTTLYRAAMRAGIKSVERYNHTMPTSYSPVGLDATVVWGALDYKFKNTYDFPIYIEAYTSNRNVIVNIYGNVAGLQGKSYELFADVVEKYEPTITKVNDPTILEGQTQWDKKPVTGYKVKSYLVTYKNGVEIARENIATDIYKKVDGVMKVGTKKVEQPSQPVDTDPTQQQNQQPLENNNNNPV